MPSVKANKEALKSSPLSQRSSSRTDCPSSVQGITPQMLTNICFLWLEKIKLIMRITQQKSGEA